MALSEKLYTLRKKNGLSQEQLAEKLHVSRQAISKWESGSSIPESDKLIAISDYFRVSLDFLLKDDEPQKNDPSAVEKQALPLGNDLSTAKEQALQSGNGSSAMEEQTFQPRNGPSAMEEQTFQPGNGSSAMEEQTFQSGNGSSAMEEQTFQPGKNNTQWILGMIACIGGMICLIIWGIVSIFNPSASNQLSESSMISIDGNGIFLILCIAAIVAGAVLLLKGSHKKQ